MNSKNNTLGLRLKYLRRSRKMSQAELGSAVGLSQQAIVAIETGRRETTITRAVDIANYFDATLDFIVGRASAPFTSYLLSGFEDTLLDSFLLEAQGRRAIEDSDFFHFIVHRSLIADPKGCYLPQDQRTMSYITPERIEILICLWGLRDASHLIDKIDSEQKWRAVKSDEDLETYWASLVPLLANSDLTEYIHRNHELESDEYAGTMISAWIVAYETLCKYGLEGITYAQNEVESKIELARKKNAEELAEKIARMQEEAEEELNKEIDKIRKDMRTEKRKKQ